METEKRITREEALKAYDKPEIKMLLETLFPTFEDYWKECERINNLSDNDFEIVRARELGKLESIKIRKGEELKNDRGDDCGKYKGDRKN